MCIRDRPTATPEPVTEAQVNEAKAAIFDSLESEVHDAQFDAIVGNVNNGLLYKAQ